MPTRRPREIALNTADATPNLLAEGFEFHTPSISEFFPDAILFGGTWFEFNRVQLVRLIILVVVLTVMAVIASRAKLVPGRAQSIVEMIIEFVDHSIIENTLGMREGKKYAPMLVTMFFFILTMNLAGVIPGLNLAGTSVIGLPLLAALWTFIVYISFGIKKHGLGGYLKHETMPPGVPKPIYILLIPIEFLQLAVIRWASLTIRLLANMVAGHIMLVVFIGLTQGLLFSGSALIAVAPFSGALAIGIYGFEIFVAALQAFIFTILTAVYINMATSDEH
ncbi:F0F1 ATP synthase subunit A [Brachybacterium halotolerans subsp. kimchii]|uniref:ATP synthase subunit a n=2 Tax=Brachybacterium TaxID=43668 RepID=A0ABS1B6U2_9MICO|nr:MULTISPECIES: F0F1 ATP synthase subunit A [Brachybacterium]MBK0330363.1 F0F1 ATP synthase subunit A [Brachybacterium halotolerans]MCG7307958.1 F0F1 ATP synthase subunit A [Brachybacterium sp. ACRRE]UEJ82875.1 F0F1 ATP synthase subunit A [Brachybacterium halotolerans subsp. kimchii]UQN30222.1 F0F1 ATP synthase subunit A [Brachybacterium kimchii]